MFETLRKLGLYGIGLAALTEEKIEEMVNEAVREGRLSKEEGKTAFKELIEEAKKERERLNRTIKKEVQKALEELGISQRKELERLSKRITELEKEIRELLKKERTG